MGRRRRRPSAVHDPKGYEDAVYWDEVKSWVGGIALVAGLLVAPIPTLVITGAVIALNAGD